MPDNQETQEETQDHLQSTNLHQTEALTAEQQRLLNDVLMKGDISKLTPKQVLKYHLHLCNTLGLNPFTRPFRIIKFKKDGREEFYATKDCTDQLRKVNKISIDDVSFQFTNTMVIATAKGSLPDGRSDVATGVVGISGEMSVEARSNCIMRSETKAKRRLTLSLCGLGLTDESELHTIPNIETKDIVAPDKDGGEEQEVIVAPDEAPPVPVAEIVEREEVSEKAKKVIELFSGCESSTEMKTKWAEAKGLLDDKRKKFTEEDKEWVISAFVSIGRAMLLNAENLGFLKMANTDFKEIGEDEENGFGDTHMDVLKKAANHRFIQLNALDEQAQEPEEPPS